MPKPLDVTDATFVSEVEMVPGAVLVDFWAPWCGPCKMMGPIIEQVANEYVDKAVVCKMDTDDQRQAAITYSISAIPTLILFKDGKPAERLVGAMPKASILSQIQRHIA